MLAPSLSSSAAGSSELVLESSVSPSAALPDAPLADSAGLAHDAGNLLGALTLYCDLLAAPGVLRAEHRHYATELQRLAKRSSAMVRRLLQQASEAQQVDLCDPAQTLREFAPALTNVASPSCLVLEVPQSLPRMRFPAEVLERITLNLVRNAAQAISLTPAEHLRGERGCIRVGLEVCTGSLQLTVEDNGPGMPPAMAAAFVRPQPLPRGATRGLGHRIVHELVSATGGELALRVRQGHGTLFRLRWPLRKPDECAPTHTEPTRTEPTVAGQGGWAAC